jgi:hypothetical protein
MPPVGHTISTVSRARPVISAAIFLILGALASAVGLHDLFRGTIIEAQLYGAAVAAAGILMLVAGARLLVDTWRQAWGAQTALLAGFAGAVLGASLLIDQFNYVDGGRRLLLGVWAGWIVACVIAIVVRPRPRPAPGTSHDGRAWPVAATLSSLGISATLVFSVVQFWYEQAKSSSSNNAYGLSISEQLVDGGQLVNRPFHQFAVHVMLKNPTGFEVQVLRSTYGVFGRSVTVQSGSDADFVSRLVTSRLNGTFNSRYVTYGPRQLVEEGEMLTTPAVLQSEQEFTIDFQLLLPQEQLSKFDYLRLETNFIVAKSSRLHASISSPRSIGACSAAVGTADQCIVTEWRIASPGWLWSLTKGGQKIETVEGLKTTAAGDQNQAAWITSCILRDQGDTTALGNPVCDDPRRDEALERFFDLGYLSPVEYDAPIQTARQP